jgi:hypothetical protein
MSEPIHHDHVGQMVWGDDECYCRGCGQRWVWRQRWVPITVEQQ